LPDPDEPAAPPEEPVAPDDPVAPEELVPAPELPLAAPGSVERERFESGPVMPPAPLPVVPLAPLEAPVLELPPDAPLSRPNIPQDATAMASAKTATNLMTIECSSV
jgi:hypothetical protein